MVDGLRLYEEVVTAAEERELIGYVDMLVEEGRRGHLGGLTYSPGISAGFWKAREKVRHSHHGGVRIACTRHMLLPTTYYHHIPSAAAPLPPPHPCRRRTHWRLMAGLRRRKAAP